MTIPKTPAKPRTKLTSVHYAWILMYFNTLLFFSRSGTDVTSVDGGSAYRISLAIGASLLLIINLLRDGKALGTLVTSIHVWFFAYGFIGLLSSTYSSSAFYSMWKSIEILIIAILPVFLVSKKDNEGVALLFKLTAILFVATLLNAYAGLLYAPGDAVRATKGLIPISLQGVKPWLNANTIGSIAAISAFFLLTSSFKTIKRSRRWLLYFLSALAYGAVLFSTSRTAIAASLAGLLVYAYFDRRYKLLTILMLLAIAVMSVDLFKETTIDYLQKEQSDKALTTLSGRTIGWTAAWEYFKEAPIFGHGLAAAGRFDILGGHFTTLHGALFDVLVGVGATGTICWLFAIIFTALKLLKPSGRIAYTIEERFGRAQAIGMLAIIIVRTFTNSSIAFHDRETLLFLSITAIACMGRSAYATLGRR